MPPLSDRLRIVTPASLTELLAVLNANPHSFIYSGGTYIMGKHRGVRFPRLPETIVALDRIDELKRITRSERHFDIGSAASITSILEVGGKVVPTALSDALRTIGYRPIRNLATLGGNVCVPDARVTAFPVLLLLDAQLELKRTSRSRWVSLSRFVHADGNLNLQPGEVCTRIRIPRGEWNVQEYRNTQSYPRASSWGMSFCGVANTQKGSLSDLRFAFGSMGKTIIRNREIEAELIGRKLPLGARDVDAAARQLELSLESITPALNSFQRRTTLRYFSWFLETLPD